MRDLEELFAALATSAFRRKFKLGAREETCMTVKGLPVVLQHARGIVDRRLAPAHPLNDGRQTPFRGHPVFVAQHATATCCRGCLQNWHWIQRGEPLSDAQIDHVVNVLGRWLDSHSYYVTKICQLDPKQRQTAFPFFSSRQYLLTDWIVI